MRRGGGEIYEKRKKGGIDEKINSRMRKVLKLTKVIKTIESVIWLKLRNLVDKSSR